MIKLDCVNTFLNGINLDQNPMTIPNNCLSNCLNGTYITNDGDDGLLLNDMGNSKVEQIHLDEGYIPVGMCVHGGITYIASYNPQTKEGQIGSFPSPISTLYLIKGGFDSKIELNNNIQKKVNAIFPDKTIIHPGDKFILYESDALGDSNTSNIKGSFFNKKIISNTDNVLNNKIKSPKNKAISISVCVLDINGNLHDITHTLKRFEMPLIDSNIDQDTKDLDELVFNEGINPEIIYNSGTIFKKLKNNISTNDIKDYNIYNFKMSGNLYIVYKLNTLDSFEVSVDILKPKETINLLNLDFDWWFSENDFDPNKEINVNEIGIISEITYKYNSPDGDYEKNTDSSETILNDSELEKIESSITELQEDSKYLSIKGFEDDFESDIKTIKGTKISVVQKEKENLKLLPFIIDDKDNAIYNELTNLYTLKNTYFLKFNPPFVNGKIEGPLKLQFDVLSRYGILNHFSRNLQINLDKINSGETELTEWKYYVNDDKVIIKYGIESYPLLGTKIRNLKLNFINAFLDLNKVIRIPLELRNSYFGVFLKQLLFGELQLRLMYLAYFSYTLENSLDEKKEYVFGMRTLLTTKRFNFLFTNPDINDYNDIKDEDLLNSLMTINIYAKPSIILQKDNSKWDPINQENLKDGLVKASRSKHLDQTYKIETDFDYSEIEDTPFEITKNFISYSKYREIDVEDDPEPTPDPETPPITPDPTPNPEPNPEPDPEPTPDPETPPISPEQPPIDSGKDDDIIDGSIQKSIISDTNFNRPNNNINTPGLITDIISREDWNIGGGTINKGDSSDDKTDDEYWNDFPFKPEEPENKEEIKDNFNSSITFKDFLFNVDNINVLVHTDGNYKNNDINLEQDIKDSIEGSVKYMFTSDDTITVSTVLLQLGLPSYCIGPSKYVDIVYTLVLRLYFPEKGTDYAKYQLNNIFGGELGIEKYYVAGVDKDARSGHNDIHMAKYIGIDLTGVVELNEGNVINWTQENELNYSKDIHKNLYGSAKPSDVFRASDHPISFNIENIVKNSKFVKLNSDRDIVKFRGALTFDSKESPNYNKAFLSKVTSEYVSDQDAKCLYYHNTLGGNWYALLLGIDPLELDEYIELLFLKDLDLNLVLLKQGLSKNYRNYKFRLDDLMSNLSNMYVSSNYPYTIKNSIIPDSSNCMYNSNYRVSADINLTYKHNITPVLANTNIPISEVMDDLKLDSNLINLFNKSNLEKYIIFKINNIDRISNTKENIETDVNIKQNINSEENNITEKDSNNSSTPKINNVYRDYYNKEESKEYIINNNVNVPITFDVEGGKNIIDDIYNNVNNASSQVILIDNNGTLHSTYSISMNLELNNIIDKRPLRTDMIYEINAENRTVVPFGTTDSFNIANKDKFVLSRNKIYPNLNKVNKEKFNETLVAIDATAPGLSGHKDSETRLKIGEVYCLTLNPKK